MSILLALVDGIGDFLTHFDQVMLGMAQHPDAMGEVIKGNYVLGYKSWEGFDYDSIPVNYFLDEESIVECVLDCWVHGLYDN